MDSSTKFNLVPPSPIGPIATAIRAQVNTSTNGEDNEEPICYMCMESTCGDLNTPFELIAPCVCHSYVHRQCLDYWRVTSNTYQAMTRCPTCHQHYEVDRIVLADTDSLKRQIRKEQLWRWGLVLGVILLGSMVLWLLDRGTPAFLHLHWNALDGKIYDGIGLTNVPRFVVYFVLSLLMMCFITGLVATLAWVCHYHTSSPECCNFCFEYSSSGCDGCNCSGCDCGGGEFGVVVGVVFVVCIAFVGVAALLTAVVGGVGSAIDRRGEKRIRSLQIQRERVRNLRPRYDVV
ncbi:Aste57867_11276 [Aphanomyces stellatus]|uniref:Aste57867_11276 protein n=1 Tax=Aphanomyces stellatus TaxID=120398 RepID=A0A485KTQ0_9STRA|nr:hypothetical protein As57867_011234 [Aphanomyces stellatus]VFT88138.1 Aste57867_11276 [Aphanomyces stellatus]